MLAGKRRGIRSSGSLFLFWFLLAICGGFTYRARIESIIDGVCHLLLFILDKRFHTCGFLQMSKAEEYPFVWDMIYYPLVIIMLFINCFADKEPLYREGEAKSDVSLPLLATHTQLDR